MNDGKRIDLFNRIRVKVNLKGYNNIYKLFGKEYLQKIDEDGYITLQMYEFFNMFFNCVDGFEYFVYTFERLDGYKNINVIFDHNTNLGISLTDIGMIELYDIEFDGFYDEPNKTINMSVDMLIKTIGKYFHSDKEFPIERNIYVKDKHLSKVKSLKN